MKTNYEPKPLFIERMKLLLGEEEFKKYFDSLNSESFNSIRVNTLKISVEKLKERLIEKKWRIKQPFRDFPEIMIVESNLEPGELGRSLEHLLGYYYIQDISSMLPIISLKPNEKDIVMDLCASPGSKTTQIASEMKNSGVLIANEINLGRIKILASNLERSGVMNAIITKSPSDVFCKKMKSLEFGADKILLDAPCSGEGTIISNKKTLLMWNKKNIKNLSKKQKRLIHSAIEVLKDGGELVYSTCTHAPEENEEVIDYALENFKNIKVEKISLPNEFKFRQGVTEWNGKEYSSEVKKCVRIYPQDNNTEGFFIAKIKKEK